MKGWCEVCDRPGDLEEFHGHRMHVECAPTPWTEDREKATEFMTEIENRPKGKKR